MIAAIILIGMLGLVSCMLTTPEQRIAARQRLARWNPLFIGLILAQLAFILWPRR